MYSGPQVNLQQLLDCKEQRAYRQREWVNTHSLPLISFTINMVGVVKKNAISEKAFDAGYYAILETCLANNIAVVRMETVVEVTGYELLIAAKCEDPYRLKCLMVKLEENHHYGRLFDIDVISTSGLPMSREMLRLPKRRCLLCENEAKSCARNRTHPLSELIHKMSEITHDCQ
ncbi:citrate lyase holo-[acyl-carrier protein] synthase [Vibrio anguillarum]|uniref:citrate lyase holo-[acyl-carrier protein] synthase n=8 Tax=Vibrio anguillarum TaxID=55601 RepID=A0A1Y0NWG9_VIBAN|nr:MULTISPECIES: citrate lyase holo-[acyl-carrier protein] synthase [Vibrio]NNN46939.1 citrate lyase holo-[acyl-carrier protein] synthase [Vibrio sp. 2-2(8)]NNN69071.1 citrate lyase holo-[acyl-carrier protein] synthase [Vibrio sp. 3-2(1)]AEH33333.1 Apo-citrate lyase phosphoribosyl-dephospho-CoA transferase [Vibrio anguillarum 775]AGU58900.1 ACP synthase [Vibrio anguillarum M3]ARV27233.1 holo-ACP synthase CitX [Vibrio anguillarum]